MKPKAEFWAVVANLEDSEHWNIVGLNINGADLALVNSRREIIESLFKHVSKEAKAKGARIARFQEVEE